MLCQKSSGRGYTSFYPMFLFLLGASLTFGAGLLAAAIYTDGALLALQCNRCAEKLGFSWVMCQESVRLEYCESKAGDERTCPSPIPHSHPG